MPDESRSARGFTVSRRYLGAALNGVCGGLAASVLGFTITDWQWWLVMAAVIVARINGQEMG